MRSALRPHQASAIDRLRSSLGSGKRRPVVQAPTGYGKTILAAAIVEMALSKGSRVVFCCPAVNLIDQTVEKFYAEGISDVGVIQADHPMTDWSKPVQIASVQTLERRGRPNAQLVIVDECHRMYKFMSDWMSDPEWRETPFIGLSATPWTVGLGKLYDDLVVASTTADLIRDGFLSPFRVFAPAHPDLSGVKIVAGDYHEKQLSEAVNRDAIVADIVSTWQRLGEDRPTLAFGVDRAHAKHIQTDFELSGVPCGYVDAFTDRRDRENIRRQFERGELKVVASVGCLTTGIDWDVRCIILARPTRSEMLFVQMIGRGLRTADGKTDCILLDHADNHARLGFVTDIHHETLSVRKPKAKSDAKKKTPLPKECAECSFLMPARTRNCPNCGRERLQQSMIETREGELAEMEAASKRPRRNERQYTMAEKQVWFSGLLKIGEERGYKPGWAANQYREKFGVWPQYLDKVAAAPTSEVRSWVQSRLIAYAKRREAERDNAAA